ncbi:MAG: hypothetical protein SGI77_25930 [Pirellulaceae bacterium]|nr:hypothetical protein [Pirellulaceae bacterium]
MTQLNPEVEAQLTALAQLCCDTLNGVNHDLIDQSEPLLKALLMCGFNRNKVQTLMVEVEQRAKNICPLCTLHRGGELASLTSGLEQKFKILVQWESTSPNQTPR